MSICHMQLNYFKLHRNEGPEENDRSASWGWRQKGHKRVFFGQGKLLKNWLKSGWGLSRMWETQEITSNERHEQLVMAATQKWESDRWVSLYEEVTEALKASDVTAWFRLLSFRHLGTNKSFGQNDFTNTFVPTGPSPPSQFHHSVKVSDIEALISPMKRNIHQQHRVRMFCVSLVITSQVPQTCHHGRTVRLVSEQKNRMTGI